MSLRVSFAFLFASSVALACGSGSEKLSQSGSELNEGEGIPSNSPLDGELAPPATPPAGGIGIDDDLTGGGGPRAPSDNVCQEYEAVSQSTPPLILILLDQSGSMNRTPANDTKSRWSYARPAVIDLVKA